MQRSCARRCLWRWKRSRRGLASGRSVALVAVAAAKAMELDEEQIAAIALGALLHEVGKLGVPDSILHKPARLDAEEMRVIRGYVQIGFEKLRQVPTLARAADVVYSHRERFDGTGYPRGLTGEAIPVGARVVAIADAFEMFLSGRPHDWSRALNGARSEISYWSGSCFDPRVVETLLKIPIEAWRPLKPGSS
jgi:HD-GYP domain-containing protein (c-di-GMP phosphodiesterase class II)